MTVRLGTNPIGWSNDDLRELGGETPLETCLAEARSGRFRRYRTGPQIPATPRTLGPILERHN
jgi:inosose dehydratase